MTTEARQKYQAELLLGIAVRVAYYLEVDPTLSEDEVMQAARKLVRILRGRDDH